MTRTLQTLLTAEQVAARIRDLGAQIDRDLPDGELVVIGVLKGSFIFMADLVRSITRPLSCDFLRVSSYAQNKSTGVVRMEFDLTQSIAGKHVLLVEDIVDTGRTLEYLRAHVLAKHPASLKIASLLYKELRPELREHIDYLGFSIPDHYVVGLGLDSDGLYRSLPYIGYFE